MASLDEETANQSKSRELDIPVPIANGNMDSATTTSTHQSEPRRPSAIENFEMEALGEVDPKSASYECHILDNIRAIVAAKENETFASWYDIKGKETDKRTFGQIWKTAGEIAYHLHHTWKVDKGQRVVLCYNFGLHFFEVFFGCLRAGVVAVLVYPPGPPLKKSLDKLNGVVKDCEPIIILTDSQINGFRLMDYANPFSKTKALWPTHIKFHATDNLRQRCLSYDEPTFGSDLAFLQYTSGSTGSPKGVMITFKAIAANTDLIKHLWDNVHDEMGDSHKDFIGFSWLPQYHDMGLIDCGIAPFVHGWRMHMVSPVTFIKNPVLWMELMSQYRVSYTIAPDFSYNLVARKFRELQQSGQPIPHLDLSCVKFLGSAAEPCRPETKANLLSAFGLHGLSEDCYGSGYGLAENCVCVSYCHGMQVSKPRDEDNGKSYIACGKLSVLPDSLFLKIVDPDTLYEVEGDQTGEIWIAGPSVAAGYFGQTELSRYTFQAKLENMPSTYFLRTGDLAFIQSGYLYVCGRIKDLIIVNGVNYYPQDIEYVVQESSTAVRPGCVAAFSASDTDGNFEVVFELRESAENPMDVCSIVAAAVARELGIFAAKVIAIAPRSIPKTTSGKIQRRATRLALHSDSLPILYSLEQCDVSQADRDLLETAKADMPEQEYETKNGSDHSGVSPELRRRDFNSIVSEVLGHTSYDPGSSWDELGLSSMMSVQLRNRIEDEFTLVLPLDFLECFNSPESLQNFLQANCGSPFEIRLPQLKTIKSTKLSWVALGVFQGFGSVILLLLFSACIIPACLVGKWASDDVTNELFDVGSRWFVFMWLPMAIPTFMIALSVLVIITKWLVIGQYQQCEISVFSVAFLRWWFVDRLVHVWEFWVGRFFKDTVILNVIYCSLGAQIPLSAKMDAMIREFDLVSIGENTNVSKDIRCRRFSPWSGDENPSLRFRHIDIGSGCAVDGLVVLGSSIEKNTRIEKGSVLLEGSQVSEGVVAKGNPAFRAGINDAPKVASVHWIQESLKICCFIFEMYNFFCCLLVAQLMFSDRLPRDWRYTKLCYWFLYIFTTNFLLTVEAIPLKWILVGRRSEGRSSTSHFRKAALWAADFHCRASWPVLLSLSSNSSFIWNSMLKAMGLDIDYRSTVAPASFSPSSVDLLQIRRSFLSTVSFEIGRNNFLGLIVISDSSLGQAVQVASGTHISQIVVPPFAFVEHDSRKEQANGQVVSLAEKLQFEYQVIFLYVFMLFVVLVSLIPAFETWQNLLKPSNVYQAFPVLAICLAIQTFVWACIMRIFQHFAYSGFREVEQTAPATALVTVFLSYSWALQTWSFLSVMYGSPLWSAFAHSFLGVHSEGKFLYFGQRIYDWNFLVIADKAIIDEAFITGHFAVYSEMTIGKTIVSGTIHEGTVVTCGARLVESESGPCRFCCTQEESHRKLTDNEDTGSHPGSEPTFYSSGSFQSETIEI